MINKSDKPKADNLVGWTDLDDLISIYPIGCGIEKSGIESILDFKL